MPPKSMDIPAPRASQFEDRAVEVLQQLREAFLHLIDSLPSPPITAADLDKALGVNRTLGWQIHRIATSPTPLEAGFHVPGMSAVQQVLRAARIAGAPEQQLHDALDAMKRFEAFVEQHAGERAAFITMLNSLVGQNDEAIDLKTRRQAFRAMSQAWGVQVKTSLACELFWPGRTPDHYDVVSLRGLRGIRRLRSGAPFRLTTRHFIEEHKDAVHAEGLGAGSLERQPGLNLLEEFCTKPIPQLEHRFEHQRMDTYLRDMPLGNTGVQSIYLADVARDLDWTMPAGVQRVHTRFCAIFKPIETLVLDTLIHKEMFESVQWEAKVCGSLDRLGEVDPEKFRADETLPIKAELLDLGVGPSALPTPHVPRYREMVESVCRDVGWDAREFRLYRCIIEFPMLSSVVCVKYLLPDKGNW